MVKPWVSFQKNFISVVIHFGALHKQKNKKEKIQKKIKKNWKKIKSVCVCVCVRERERERENYARMPSKLSKTDWERLNEQDWKIW